MIESILLWLVDIIGHFGYIGLIVLMAMESSFVPLPSELILPPAGYLVFQGKMEYPLVILYSTLGSILGSLFSYWLGDVLGRKILIRYGKYVGLTEQHYQKADQFFQKHGSISIFVSRLIFGIRHVISFPAGVTKMRLVPFVIYTIIGAGLWAVILTALGYFVGKNQDLLHRYYQEIGIGLVIFCVALVGIYIIWYKKRTSH
jgi:membrane protein DedA with SNARE-associated domain